MSMELNVIFFFLNANLLIIIIYNLQKTYLNWLFFVQLGILYLHLKSKELLCSRKTDIKGF